MKFGSGGGDQKINIKFNMINKGYPQFRSFKVEHRSEKNSRNLNNQRNENI